ncbi:hypothetical protein GCM10010441_13290 [Kitasatospora paracochleata]|uniref:Secreted protein n=1 Tax=Kitasatospora paracochleata TaxID=58354 RepID=A0ABT1JAU4_9ACTN|nr:hypothetical protein [Kitasatospora paracochleata]MCP2314571.1 hypothetical protein [Kitasatospora paracochleata]
MKLQKAAVATLTAALVGASLIGFAGSAQAAGGCRYDYASVGYGYRLEPCIETGPGGPENFNAEINVRVDPYSTDVQICGELVSVSGWGNIDGVEHCAPFAGTRSAGAVFTTAYTNNEHCPLHTGNALYVYKGYIKESGHVIGDIESPIFTCPGV